MMFDKQPFMKKIKANIIENCIAHCAEKYPHFFSEENQCNEHVLSILNYTILVLLRKHCKFKMNIIKMNKLENKENIAKKRINVPSKNDASSKKLKKLTRI